MVLTVCITSKCTLKRPVFNEGICNIRFTYSAILQKIHVYKELKAVVIRKSNELTIQLLKNKT